MPIRAETIADPKLLRSWCRAVLKSGKEPVVVPGQRAVVAFTDTGAGVEVQISIFSPSEESPGYAEMALAVAVHDHLFSGWKGGIDADPS